MRDEHTEARIIISGFDLSPAEAMTIRVALEAFASSLEPVGALGTDKHAKAMRAGYMGAIERIRWLMLEGKS